MRGGAAASTAMDSRQNDGIPRVVENSFDDGNGFMKSPPLGDHLMPIEVRSDIRMGDPNVPQPRDLVRIQYGLTEIDLGGGKADGHFG